jgi:hypothetical protein
MGAKGHLRYSVRCWCDESGAEGTYEHKAPSRVDAIERAVEAFRLDCESAAARYVPPCHRIQTEIVGIRA